MVAGISETAGPGRVGESEIQALEDEQPAFQGGAIDLLWFADAVATRRCLVGWLRLVGLKWMRPEYRALLRGPYGASYMGLCPIPPHPARPSGPECSRTAPSCQERARRPQ